MYSIQRICKPQQRQAGGQVHNNRNANCPHSLACMLVFCFLPIFIRTHMLLAVIFHKGPHLQFGRFLKNCASTFRPFLSTCVHSTCTVVGLGYTKERPSGITSRRALILHVSGIAYQEALPICSSLISVANFHYR